MLEASSSSALPQTACDPGQVTESLHFSASPRAPSHRAHSAYTCTHNSWGTDGPGRGLEWFWAQDPRLAELLRPAPELSAWLMRALGLFPVRGLELAPTAITFSSTRHLSVCRIVKLPWQGLPGRAVSSSGEVPWVFVAPKLMGDQLLL